LIPGHEAVGTIVAMGDEVKGFEKGDRVAADVGGESPTRLSSRMARTRLK
jgi:D-arabinose 1-dehydrogenase-like Zn-dependent alcohol dehydrogenase